MNRFKIQYGFSLLEVLVSVVVLGVGLLGVAALQARAIEYNHSAELRSIAVSQLNSMLDRMKANYSGVRSGYYNLSTPSSAKAGKESTNCTACTNAQIAEKDTQQWNQSNANLLPAGQGTIQSNGTNYTLTIRWDNNRTGAKGLNCSGDPDIDLTCLSMEVRL